jgi:PKD repeat protein
VNVAVTFDGSASRDPDGSIAIYWWQFGDGGSASVSTPTVAHTYTTAGTFTLTLWVQDNRGTWSAASDATTATIGTGSSTTTSTSSSTSSSTSRPTTTSSPVPTTTSTSLPNQLPVPNAGADQLTQTLTTITLNGSLSHDPDGTITSASWTFGDGGTGSGLTTTHAYMTAGTFTARLTVVDNRGGSASDTATITVTNRPPTANAGPDEGAAPNIAIDLNGSQSNDPDGAIVTYAWSFGDGGTGNGPTPLHTYAAPGVYTARLTVTDNNGAVASDDALITVTTASPWADAIGSTDSDSALAVAIDGAGNTIVGGTIKGSVTVAPGKTLVSAGNTDAFVAKFGPTGTLVWANRMGGTSDDTLEAVAVAPNGDVVVAGRFTGSASFGGTNLVANGTMDMAVAKYAAGDGHHLWSKRFGGEYDDTASAVAVDGSGNVYLTGYFRGTVDFGGGPITVPFTSDLDVFLAKLDPAGNHLWSKNFTNTGNDRGYGIAVDASGNVAITGYFSNSISFGGTTFTSLNAMTDVFVARFTTAGVHSWSKQLGASDGNEGGNGVAMDSAGNVLVTGYAIKPVDFGGGALSALGSTDAFVAKYAATSGAHMWSRRLGSIANDYGYGVAVNRTTNDVYVTGAFEGAASFGGSNLTPVGGSDAFVAKYTSTGTFTWVHQLGGTSADVGRAIDVNGGALATVGYFFGSGSFEGIPLSSAGLSDAYVVRVAP